MPPPTAIPGSAVGTYGALPRVDDAWLPTHASYPVPSYPVQTLAPQASQLSFQGLLATLDRLLARMGSAAQQGGSVVTQFCQSVAEFFASPPAAQPALQPAPPSPAQPTPQPEPKTPVRPTRFVLSSFNVLSSSAGKSKGFAPGPERMHAVAEILRANQVSVVGFQEMDHRQLAEFKKVTGDTYGTFAGASGIRGYHDTTLAWRKDTWKLVKGDTITVPSYEGRESKVPYVRLRNKQTGQEAYFVDVHNPANTRRHHHQERYRDAAARQEAALVRKLFEQSGLPVFLVGDMNSVGEAREIFTTQAPIKAANPSRKSGIDWIFGTRDVQFGEFRRDRSGLIAKTTDHPVLFTNVKIGPA
jgi:hypothetical protein